jgi:hypothetical protein
MENYEYVESEIMKSAITIGREQRELIYEDCCIIDECPEIFRFGIHSTSLEFRSTCNSYKRHVEAGNWIDAEGEGRYMEDIVSQLIPVMR